MYRVVQDSVHVLYYCRGQEDKEATKELVLTSEGGLLYFSVL